jgi:hypothetical protein
MPKYLHSIPSFAFFFSYSLYAMGVSHAGQPFEMNAIFHWFSGIFDDCGARAEGSAQRSKS